jgi:hypothetical protein
VSPNASSQKPAISTQQQKGSEGGTNQSTGDEDAEEEEPLHEFVADIKEQEEEQVEEM